MVWAFPKAFLDKSIVVFHNAITVPEIFYIFYEFILLAPIKSEIQTKENMLIFFFTNEQRYYASKPFHKFCQLLIYYQIFYIFYEFILLAPIKSEIQTKENMLIFLLMNKGIMHQNLFTNSFSYWFITNAMVMKPFY